MKIKNKKIAWFAVLALFPVLVMAQAKTKDTVRVTHHEFSARQAIEYAAKNNVEVKNALLDVKMQEQVNREITSYAYPRLNASLGTTYNPNISTQVLPNFISPATYQVLIDEGVKDGSGNPIQMPSDFGNISAQFGVKYSATAGVTLSQLLFDGQVFVGLQARDATIAFAQKNAEVTEEIIKTNIYKIYYQLVVSRTHIELLDTNIALLQRLLKDTRVIHQNGLAEQLDVDKVSVQLTNLLTEKNKTLSIVSNGYYGLKVLMGMPVTDELVLTDTLSDEQVKDATLGMETYTYEDRKEYQYAQIGKKLNEYNIRRYKLSQAPTVTLNGQYLKNAQRDQWNFFESGAWFTISNINLNVAIPIFNGFYYKSKIQQAKINLQQTENHIVALQLSIDNEVATAKNNFRVAISTMDFQRKNMDLAGKVYQQTKRKYEMGIGNQTDINVAQGDLKNAQANYVSALYDAVIAKIDFLRATGKL